MGSSASASVHPHKLRVDRNLSQKSGSSHLSSPRLNLSSNQIGKNESAVPAQSLSLENVNIKDVPFGRKNAHFLSESEVDMCRHISSPLRIVFFSDAIQPFTENRAARFVKALQNIKASSYPAFSQNTHDINLRSYEEGKLHDDNFHSILLYGGSSLASRTQSTASIASKGALDVAALNVISNQSQIPIASVLSSAADAIIAGNASQFAENNTSANYPVVATNIGGLVDNRKEKRPSTRYFSVTKTPCQTPSLVQSSPFGFGVARGSLYRLPQSKFASPEPKFNRKKSIPIPCKEKKIGILGITDMTSACTCADLKGRIKSENTIQSLHKAAEKLKQEGAEFIIVMARMSERDCYDVARTVTSIDIILLVTEEKSEASTKIVFEGGCTVIEHSPQYYSDGLDRVSIIDIATSGEIDAYSLDITSEKSEDINTTVLMTSLDAHFCRYFLSTPISKSSEKYIISRACAKENQMLFLTRIADAMRVTTAADVAIINGDILAEKSTHIYPGQIISVSLLADTISEDRYCVLINMTGRDLRKFINFQVSGDWFPQVSGISFKIQEPAVNASNIRVSGENLLDEKVYKVCVSDNLNKNSARGNFNRSLLMIAAISFSCPKQKMSYETILKLNEATRTESLYVDITENISQISLWPKPNVDCVKPIFAAPETKRKKRVKRSKGPKTVRERSTSKAKVRTFGFEPEKLHRTWYNSELTNNTKSPCSYLISLRRHENERISDVDKDLFAIFNKVY